MGFAIHISYFYQVYCARTNCSQFGFRLKSTFIGFLILVLFLLSHESFAGQWMYAVVRDGGAVLRREPKDSPTALGKYSAGTKVRIFTPDRGGYFALYFSKPWKGAQYAW